MNAADRVARLGSSVGSREQALAQLDGGEFDVLVIGGGATGLGVAVDAASRGYKTALLEGGDFASGTSSRSTKLVHGGVRYLEQLDIALVTEALRERGIMHTNAPHIVHDLAFVVPQYSWWEGPFYGAGLKIYDLLAGKRNLAPSQMLTAQETIDAIPNVSREGLVGGVRYHDGQFDDARMAIALMRTAQDHGAVLVNHVRVTALQKGPSGRVNGLRAVDGESGREFSVRARVLVNAAGIWSDSIRRMDESTAQAMVEPAQGIHLVLPREFQPSDTAIMVPHTDDGRVLFVIPWHGRVIVGTTDTPMPRAEVEPHALPEEIEFVLRNVARYLERDPARSDVLSVFAGQRPLVHAPGASGPTKKISREHRVIVSDGGLVTIIGGKWTTYRQMAEDAMTHAIEAGSLAARECITRTLPVHGSCEPDSATVAPQHEWRRYYGTDGATLAALEAADATLAQQIHPLLPYARSAVVFAARHEMARTVEDVLARRTRSLLLDARAAMECAGDVAALLGDQLGRDRAWQADEVVGFHKLARGYLLPG